jgi:hypothetical protein
MAPAGRHPRPGEITLAGLLRTQAQNAVSPGVGRRLEAELFARRPVDRDHFVDFGLHLHCAFGVVMQPVINMAAAAAASNERDIGLLLRFNKTLTRQRLIWNTEPRMVRRNAARRHDL